MSFITKEQSSIMRAMDTLSLGERREDTGSFVEIDNHDDGRDLVSLNINFGSCFLLVSEDETAQADTVEDFIDRLGCSAGSKLKVISIFGNSGDGKSYYLNNLLFKGDEVFKTSKSAQNGTRGVWAAYHGAKNLLCLDTPPLRYSESSDIMLMKILAISDAVIYRTRSERLPEDLFIFLGQAANAFREHFKPILDANGHRVEDGGPASAQGPAVFIFHEPFHSDPLSMGPNGDSPEDQIRLKFKSMNFNIDILGKIYYIPVRGNDSNIKAKASKFEALMNEMNLDLNNSALRAPRSPESILITLKALLSRFRGQLVCYNTCEVCKVTCCLSSGHEKEHLDHSSNEKCRYHYQYENKILICRKCKNEVRTVEQPQETWLSYAKSALNGYELICNKCGPIYKSRQYWFGNQSPEETVVYPKFIHVWSGQDSSKSGNKSVGVRKALEGVGNLMNTAYIYSTDCIAPSYWQPNSEISNCAVCSTKLEFGRGEVHHCRACGLGVCNLCSETRMPVPSRGWDYPVRVCNTCKNKNSHHGNPDEATNITPRKVSEAVINAFKPLGVALNYPKGVITKLARPSYWVPDEEAPSCAGCDVVFGFEGKNARHHCRSCGNSVCGECSPHRAPIPDRGWNEPVRVCKNCIPGGDGNQ